MNAKLNNTNISKGHGDRMVMGTALDPSQDANAILIPKEDADEAMDCASCIGCGACVAACKNGSAMLFVSSKVSQLALLPRAAWRLPAASRTWWPKWTNSASATAPTLALARPSARRTRPSATSPASTAR